MPPIGVRYAGKFAGNMDCQDELYLGRETVHECAIGLRGCEWDGRRRLSAGSVSTYWLGSPLHHLPIFHLFSTTASKKSKGK